MKRAGYYLLDITRCGKNYHLGYERWINFAHTQELIDCEWNYRFYTKDLHAYAIIASVADYRIIRENMSDKLSCPRKSKAAKRLIPRPYYLEVKKRRLIKPR